MPDDECSYPAALPESVGFLTHMQLLFAGQGPLEHSPYFYGYYESARNSPSGYNLPLWYLITNIVLFVASLIAISIRAGRGIEKEIVGKSGQMFKYSSMILSGWDCNISDSETGQLKKRLRARVPHRFFISGLLLPVNTV